MLNVKCEATSGDIKKSFRKRALIVHPDKPGGDHKLFQTLSEAFEVLSDQQARTAYDATLRKKGSRDGLDPGEEVELYDSGT